MNQYALRADLILMHSYESVNGVNCYGYTPKKSNSIDFKRALKKALKIASNMHPAIYNHLFTTYAQDPNNK